MPQTQDPLAHRLDESRRQSLHEWFAHYEVEIISCVYWRNRAPWDVPRRQCFDSFFLFPVRGEVRVTRDADQAVIAPGQYLALADREWHSLELVPGFARLEQIGLHCRIQDRWRRPFLARFASPFARLDDPDAWHTALADLASLMSTDPALGRSRGQVLVLDLMARRICRESDPLAPFHHEGDPRIGQVLRRMREGFTAQDLSVEMLAAEIGLTATQMRKLFRRETGGSPKQYLGRLRLERAVHLLRHSALSVKQIARECGYANDNYFHLVFRAGFGLTPNAYRGKETV